MASYTRESGIITFTMWDLVFNDESLLISFCTKTGTAIIEPSEAESGVGCYVQSGSFTVSSNSMPLKIGLVMKRLLRRFPS